MPRLPLLSPSQQVARHLREELQRGVWREEMPGIPYLAAELGLDAKTVIAALRLLEEEGILEHQGNGRRRRIVELASPPSPSLRLAILLGEAADGKLEYMTDLQHRLRENGHSPFFFKQSMVEMGMDVRRIARMWWSGPTRLLGSCSLARGRFWNGSPRGRPPFSPCPEGGASYRSRAWDQTCSLPARRPRAN